MKKASLVLKMICASLIILVGFVWLCVNLSIYDDFVDTNLLIDSNRVDFGDYLVAYGGSYSLLFFISILMMIVGAYMLFNLLSCIEFKSRELEKLSALSRYKTLFDNGVISQEEFEAKKQQLLGLM